VTRAKYLFHLSSLCSCPPSFTDALGVGDFVQLITGIDAAKAGR